MDAGVGWSLLFYGGYFGPVSPPLVSSAVGVSSHSDTAITSGACTVTNADQSLVQCAFPDGVGVGYTWRIIVGGVAALAPLLPTSFAPPSVSSVIVSGAPAGANDVPTAGGATSAIPPPPLFLPPGAIADANDEAQFGELKTVTLQVVVGGQSTPTWTPLRYTNPSLDRVALQLRQQNEPIVDIHGVVLSPGGVIMNCGVASADGTAAPGGALAVLELTGANLGGNATLVNVSVASAPCILLAHAQDHIVCATSMCRGPLVVTVDGLTSPRDASAYEYVYNTLAQAPTIGSVVPLTGPLSGGTAVTLVGAAFKGAGDVYFQALGDDGELISTRAACVWRGITGMGCTDTSIK